MVLARPWPMKIQPRSCQRRLRRLHPLDDVGWLDDSSAVNLYRAFRSRPSPGWWPEGMQRFLSWSSCHFAEVTRNWWSSGEALRVGRPVWRFSIDRSGRFGVGDTRRVLDPLFDVPETIVILIGVIVTYYDKLTNKIHESPAIGTTPQLVLWNAAQPNPRRQTA